MGHFSLTENALLDAMFSLGIALKSDGRRIKKNIFRHQKKHFLERSKKTFLGIKKNIFWRPFVRRVGVALIPGEIKKNIFRDQKKH